jgi:undecaprenyl-diphosphatase
MWKWGLALTSFVAALMGFLALAEDVWERDPFLWDVPMMVFLHNHSAPWLDSLMLFITQTGGLLTIPVLGIVLWFLWCQKQQELAIVLTFNFLGAVVLNALLKNLFARPRPLVFQPLTIVHTYSFPSGHTIAAVALNGCLALILWQNQRRRMAVLSGLWVFLIALSRIYLGVHYPSDVLGALLLGSAWLGLVMVLYQLSGRFHFLLCKVARSDG